MNIEKIYHIFCRALHGLHLLVGNIYYLIYTTYLYRLRAITCAWEVISLNNSVEWRCYSLSILIPNWSGIFSVAYLCWDHLAGLGQWNRSYWFDEWKNWRQGGSRIFSSRKTFVRHHDNGNHHFHTHNCLHLLYAHRDSSVCFGCCQEETQCHWRRSLRGKPSAAGKDRSKSDCAERRSRLNSNGWRTNWVVVKTKTVSTRPTTGKVWCPKHWLKKSALDLSQAPQRKGRFFVLFLQSTTTTTTTSTSYSGTYSLTLSCTPPGYSEYNAC